MTVDIQLDFNSIDMMDYNNLYSFDKPLYVNIFYLIVES